jgi:hypothetical protein
MVHRRTRERSPEGGPGTKDMRSTGRRRGRVDDGREPSEGRRDATRVRVRVPGSNIGFERNPAPTDYIRGAKGKFDTSW